jgi:hypothetical protein
MPMAKTYVVKCYANATQDFYHLSKLHSGLLELQRQQRIDLQFTRSKPVGDLLTDPPWTPWLEIMDREAGSRRRAVVDLSDSSDFFYHGALEHCDVYYKRNLHEADLGMLSEAHRPKVRAFGLNYGCRSRGQIAKMLPTIVTGLLMRAFRAPRQELRHLPNRFGAFREFLAVLPWEEYEQGPDRPLERVVCFQARASEPLGERGDEEDWINRPRVELVRTLRREFGRRFWGGLVSNEYAKRRYPDALSDQSPRRSDYIATGKRALVGIASPPCVRTGSFKLGEYLAASRCIVSAPIVKGLPSPLLENLHYLPFTNVDDCVAQCVLLLEDSSRAQEMRRNNWEYYQREVAPAKHLENLLRRAFE